MYMLVYKGEGGVRNRQNLVYVRSYLVYEQTQRSKEITSKAKKVSKIQFSRVKFFNDQYFLAKI